MKRLLAVLLLSGCGTSNDLVFYGDALSDAPCADVLGYVRVWCLQEGVSDTGLPTYHKGECSPFCKTTLTCDRLGGQWACKFSDRPALPL